MLTRHCEKCKILNTETPLYLFSRRFKEPTGVAIERLRGFAVTLSADNPHDDGAPPRQGLLELCGSCLDGEIAASVALLKKA